MTSSEERIEMLELRVDALSKQIERLSDLHSSAPPSQPSPLGALNRARVEAITRILKKVPGGQARLKDVRRELGLSPTQMSRLVKHLDDRTFEVKRMPHKNNEKVIRLRRKAGADPM
jgi:hypothetical protein